MKQLIVNADDLGLTPGINRGILEAFENGIVTSASLLVTGDAFKDAVERARQFPALDVGLHLALVDLPSLLGREALSGLVDEAGRLPRRGEFFKRALSGRINWAEVERELAAQIECFRSTGLPLSHVDSHQHLHAFPPVFEIVRRLLGGSKEVWLRNPAGPWRKPGSVSMKRWAQGVGLNLACLWLRASQGRSGLRMPDRMFGFYHAGGLDRAALRAVLRQVPQGLSELVCHPGEGDPECQARYANWGYRWAAELGALTDPGVREEMQRAGVVLTAFRQA